MQAKGRTKVRDAVREELASLRKRNSQGRQHHDRGQARVGRRIEARLALTSGEFLPRHKSQRKPHAGGFDINRIYGATELSRYDVSRCVLSRQLAKLQ